MKHTLLSISLLGLAWPSAFGLSVSSTPGSLAASLGELSAGETELTVTGSIDARDLSVLKQLPPSVKKIDLSQTRIEGYTGEADGFPGHNFFAAGEIPAMTFFGSQAETILLPSNVSTIGEGAFANSSVQEMTLPAGVKSLGEYAFYGCRSLVSVALPSTVASLGRMAFADCNHLQQASFAGNALKRLPDKTFMGCWDLSSFTLPAGVRSLGSEVFSGTTIEELDLSKVTSASEYALSGMSRLETVRLNPKARYDDGLLAGNGRLKTVEGVPAELPALFIALSQGTQLEGIMTGTEKLGDYALAGNRATSIVLSADLKEIGKGAFAGMTDLTLIDVRNLDRNIPATDPDAYTGDDPASVTVYVTTESLDTWKEDTFWGRFKVTDDISGIAVAEASDAIGISLTGTRLKVTAPSAIASCVVYDLKGNVLLNVASRAATLENDLNSLPADGMVVVAVRCADGSARTVRLMSVKNG